MTLPDGTNSSVPPLAGAPSPKGEGNIIKSADSAGSY